MKFTLVMLLTFAFGSSFSANQSIRLRDAQTGQSVDGQVLAIEVIPADFSPEQWSQILQGRWPENLHHSENPQSLATHAGRVMIGSSNRFQMLEIKSAGYKPLRTIVEPDANVRLTTVWLDATGSSRNRLKQQCQRTWLCGWVYDAESLQALSGVRIKVGENDFFSGIDGHFRVESIHTGQQVSFSIGGYTGQQWIGLMSVGAIQMIVDLNPGRGQVTKSLEHPLTFSNVGRTDNRWPDAKQVVLESGQVDVRERPGGSLFMTPPLSIRVGFNSMGGFCCGGSCTTSQAYSLETYVQRGLDNEWIASWHTDSLIAGSIPYRSYGAWHVANQPYSGYDICAGPCCQAFESTGFSSSIAAAEATNGIMLELNGAIARSEYSAENNSWNDPDDGLTCTNVDLSCGDGFVGSPAAGWPCLDDGSGGMGCFGHGRGMSQKGTQRRALAGENWGSIVDHYYNANGNPEGDRSQYSTSPVRLDGIVSNLNLAAPGDRLQLSFEVWNSADPSLQFGPVMLGASLINAIDDYSDPANDLVKHITTAGGSTLVRPFIIPSSVVPGIYDLAVALWLDVDGDGAVTSTDWILASMRIGDAIEVDLQGATIFRDSFKGF